MADPAETEDPRAPAGEAGPEDPTVMMEEVIDLLKLLNYERGFLAKGNKPTTRAQFSWPAADQSAQFAYFTA